MLRRWLPARRGTTEDKAEGRISGTVARLGPALVLTALGLLFFAELAFHPAHLLYSDHSDFLAYELPLQRFLVRSWRATGETPLWDPYSFAGISLVHDIQAETFYPPHLPLRLLPEGRVGAALSWLIVLHVLIAGWSMYAYARSQDLERIGATIAALGFMFGGKWMLHLLLAGQYMLIGLAWLPLVLLGLERAIRKGSLVSATWAGAAFAMLVLGTHPQLTMYAGLFLAAWTLGPALELAGFLGAGGRRSWRRTGAALGRWMGFGALTALVAVGLAAVQLLPSLEATRWTSRGAVGMHPDFLTDLIFSMQGLAGPIGEGMPRTVAWEYRSGLGVLWIAAALLAPFSVRSGRVRFQSLICLALVVFALGGGAALGGLPGFRLFRIPSRMYLIAALPIALLVGRTTQALFGPPGSMPPDPRRRRATLLEVLLAALATYIILLVFHTELKEYRIQAYWVSLLLTIPAAYWLLGEAPEQGVAAGRWTGNQLRVVWGAVLLVDLWALAWPLVAVRTEEEVYSPAACVRFVAAHGRGHGRVLDRDVHNRPGNTPLPAALAIVLGLEPLRGYNPMDILRYKEFLLFIAGRDNLPPPENGVGYFPIKNKTLLDLLGTRFLMEPSDPRMRPKEEEAGAAEDPRWRKVFEDPNPRAYLFVAGGIRDLPAYSVYENPEAFPRAFVVPRAEPLPERSRVLRAFERSDFRRVVFLEGPDGGPPAGTPAGSFRPATIREYRPNRVAVGVGGESPGYLVLMDPWFPGWSCTLDGRPAKLRRANYAFRAVAVPAGDHEVVFTFAPASYALGRMISGGSLAAVAGIGLLAAAVRSRGRPAAIDEDPATVVTDPATSSHPPESRPSRPEVPSWARQLASLAKPVLPRQPDPNPSTPRDGTVPREDH